VGRFYISLKKENTNEILLGAPAQFDLWISHMNIDTQHPQQYTSSQLQAALVRATGLLLTTFRVGCLL
jgi:hypothetical protein